MHHSTHLSQNSRVLVVRGSLQGTDDGSIVLAKSFLTWKTWTNLLLLLFSHSVMSNSLQTHGLQHVSLPCPSPSPRVCSNSCPLRWWCHPTISFSVVSFSFWLQFFPASGSFPMSWLFTSGDQRIGASASASVLPMNIQGIFPLVLTGLISLQVQGALKSLLQHHSSKASILWHSKPILISVMPEDSQEI